MGLSVSIWGRGAVAALLAMVCAMASAQSATPKPLSICMSEDNAPLSMARKGQLSGFDVAMAEAVALELGRPLKLIPFETELEKDSNPTHEVNALLSAGVCDLVSGYPLLASDLGAPSRPSAKTPDYPGAKRQRERPMVTLGTLVASAPYQGMALQLVQRADAPPANALGDLKAQKIGAIAGTLEGSLIATYKGGALVDKMVSLSQIDDPWKALESGQIDAMLMPSTAWDVYRKRQGESLRMRAGEPLSLGVNLGWVALSGQGELLEAVNRVIARDADLQRWAQAAAMQRLKPTLPAVVSSLNLTALMAH